MKQKAIIANSSLVQYLYIIDINFICTLNVLIIINSHFWCIIVAPLLLRMLHNTITDEVFRKGLITYLTKQ